MPSKEEKKGNKEESVLAHIKDLLLDKFATMLLGNLSDHVKHLIAKLQEVAYYTQRKIIEQFYVSGFFYAGCIFVVLSAVFFLMDTLQWSRGEAMFAAGVILLAASAGMKQYITRTRSTRLYER